MMFRYRKSYVTCLILFIVVLLHSPVYHQHVDDHHLGPLEHTDHSSPHSPNDYSANLHITEFSHEVLPEESHHAHYHLHIKEDFYRSPRIDTNKVKTISVYVFEAFNNLSTNSPTLKKQSYNYYNPKTCSNNCDKTSSGLSPPIYST